MDFALKETARQTITLRHTCKIALTRYFSERERKGKIRKGEEEEMRPSKRRNDNGEQNRDQSSRRKAITKR